MQSGSLVEFVQKNQVVVAICQQADKKDVRLLTESNKELKLPQNKITQTLSKVVNVSQNRLDLVEQLKDWANRANRQSKEVDLELLWQILEDDNSPQELETLTELNFNEVNDLNRSAVLRALSQDMIFFERKNEGFARRSAKVVEQIRQQQESEKRKVEARQNTLNWLRQANQASDKITAPPPPYSEPFIDMIQQLAIQRKRYENYQQAMDFLKEAGWKGDLELQSFNLMVRQGWWDEDENLSLIEMKVPQDFSQEIINHAANIQLDIENELHRRQDLRSLYTITIDDENTTDIDDALSWSKNEQGYLLGVHIADVSHYIQPDTPLDKESVRRFTSIYLPERKIEMLPSHLAQDICSLVANQDRLALSILIQLDEAFQIQNYQVCESIIQVKEKISYDKADEMLESHQPEELSQMYQLAKVFQQQRLAQGAMIFYQPELRIKVNEEKNISIKVIQRNSPAQNLVSEIMILANYLIAKKLASEFVPLIYRIQEKLEISDFQGKPIMKKSILTTHPGPHAGLGLELYTQFTSPIRRYNDLVLHRQIKHWLNKEEHLYSLKDLQGMVALSDQALYSANIVQKEGFRYWLYKYLEQLPSPIFEAEVVDKMEDSDKWIIYLKDYCFQTQYYPLLGQLLRVGDSFKVAISHVSPRKGVLQLRPYQES